MRKFVCPVPPPPPNTRDNHFYSYQVVLNRVGMGGQGKGHCRSRPSLNKDYHSDTTIGIPWFNPSPH
jgi:hypothetical protein